MMKGKKWRTLTRVVFAWVMVVAISVPNFTGQLRAAGISNNNYDSNKGELMTTPFIHLPLGAVEANGWLRNQLFLQKNGITRFIETFPDYDSTSAWKGGNGEDWERGPYYLRGLVALAFTTGDEELQVKAQVWVDAIIASQKSSGYFGPDSNNDWWPRMPVLMALRDYYEAKKALGEEDHRILTFMEQYFRYQEGRLRSQRLQSWAVARGGDNIDSVYWLYNKLYNENRPNDVKWLLDLGNVLNGQTQNWTNDYNHSTVRQHVVNTSQGMKTPPVRYQYTQSDADKSAIYNGLLNWSIDHGRHDGLPKSDEAARDNRSTRGTESCGVVESLLSLEIAERILGDVAIADQLEMIAYNALPAVFSPDFSGHTYFQDENVAVISQGKREYVNDHGDSATFGAPTGFDCCFSNVHMGWPKVVQNMWMATNNNGLAVIVYGPNKVKAKVANNKTAIFDQVTDYPFKDQVRLNYEGDQDISFELKLRIPSWSTSTIIKINGEAQQGIQVGEFYAIERRWQKGDAVDITFSPVIKEEAGYNNSVAVKRGSLLFGLKIGEDWRINNNNKLRELKVAPHDENPIREVFPTTPWNYGLVLNESNFGNNFSIETMDEVPVQPFTTTQAPIKLKVTGQRLPQWKLSGNIVGPQPYGPVVPNSSLQEEVELIPYGSGRLRITDIPRVSYGTTDGSIRRTTSQDGKIVRDSVDRNKKYLEFSHLVVPKASDYKLIIEGSGNGDLRLIINNKKELTVGFNHGANVDNLKGMISHQDCKFTNGHFNNVRMDVPSGVQISAIKVIPIGRSIVGITATGTRSDTTATITTNLDPQETPFEIHYGVNANEMQKQVVGFAMGSTRLAGLDSNVDTYYAKIVATIKGEKVESSLIALTKPTSGADDLEPDPNASTVQVNANFNADYWKENWTKIGATDQINKVDGKMVFGTHQQVKLVYTAGNAQSWTDYVAEADITLTSDSFGNNAGIMFRATNIEDGPDAYNGYYVGLGKIGGTTGLVVGHADGSWHDIQAVPMNLESNKIYRLKVVVHKSYYGVYVDNQLKYKAKIEEPVPYRGNGTIGIRSYQQPFTVDNVVARNVTQEDIAIFEDLVDLSGQDKYGDFVDDFANMDKWNQGQFGTQKPVISDGKLAIPSSQGGKVYLKDENALNWNNYHFEADVTMESTDGDGGLLIRSSGEEQQDSQSYYFGITKANKYVIGHFNTGWNEIVAQTNIPLPHKNTYKLAVNAYKDQLAFFIDGQKVYTLSGEEHPEGRIGFRTWRADFNVDHAVIRGLTTQEKEELSVSVEPASMQGVSIQPMVEGFQVYFPENNQARYYRIEYGEISGEYSGEATNITLSPYAASRITAAKSSVSGLKPDTKYFVRVSAISGSSILGISEELTVRTGKINHTSSQRIELQYEINKAQNVDMTKVSQQDRRRLEKAIANALSVKRFLTSNQMDYELARQLLYSARVDAKEVQIPITLEPIAHYDFTDGVKDIMGQNHGEVENVTIREGKADLNGTGYIRFPNQVLAQMGTDEISFTAWINLRENSTWSNLISIGKDNRNYAVLATKGRPAGNPCGITIGLRHQNNGQDFEDRVDASTSNEVPLNQWVHVAYTQKGDNAKYYINGMEVATGTVRQRIKGIAGEDGSVFLVGKAKMFNDPLLNGRMDDFKIYDKAIGHIQIQAEYESRKDSFN